MKQSRFKLYFIAFTVFTIIVLGCSIPRKAEIEHKSSLYKASCKHTQTFASIILWDDSVIHYNAGAFLWNLSYNGKYEINGDTIYVTWAKEDKTSLGKRFENGLLITETGIQELGDSSIHRHSFRFKWAKQHL